MIDNRGVRLVYRAFAQPGHGIDPNDWEREPGAFDLRAYGWIVIPWFDFEITQDGGQSWTQFWRYENRGNDYPGCNSFDVLDADNFCLWTPTQIGITHDGGNNWMIRDRTTPLQNYADCMA